MSGRNAPAVSVEGAARRSRRRVSDQAGKMLSFRGTEFGRNPALNIFPELMETLHYLNF